MSITHFYRKYDLSDGRKAALISAMKDRGYAIDDIETEYCFNIEALSSPSQTDMTRLRWLLSETFERGLFATKPFLAGSDVVEVGPRMNFQTAWSTNAVSICRSAGINAVGRLERSRRYRLRGAVDDKVKAAFCSLVHDRMTETVYHEPLGSFVSGIAPEPVYIVPVIEEGREALVKLNAKMGLGLDEWDLDYYHNLFANIMKRNPTNVECFDLGQSNSEHSRHWFFRGILVIDGVTVERSLMEIISAPYTQNPGRSVIAFSDNSSAIRGFRIRRLQPDQPGRPSALHKVELDLDITFTAETHNFPSGVAPFPGAETGTGGRIRDVQAVGRGGHVIAGTAAYCVGNLRIPGYVQPWESMDFKYPTNLASPLRIMIEASDGASDYGNKFGEPMIQGYTRAFGMLLGNGERREWLKPIMFTAGVGQMDSRHLEKDKPERGMLMTKIGGPAYRIGMGGGAASSMVQGENAEELDFNAVQRGDAEMEQKMNRAIRAAVEMGPMNPVVSIHDQGAGGNCNVLKEICDPEGATIDIRKIEAGDPTLSVLELWGAEYQEQNALLLKPGDRGLFESVCRREKVTCSFVGEVTGSGHIEVTDSTDGSKPVDLVLKQVLAEMPRKTFNITRAPAALRAPVIPSGLTLKAALERVLRLVSVGSKRFLVNKVDRSVTGLVARQQCAGALGLTVSDVAVIAQSHFGLTGAAISIGEQPIKGLIDPGAMARMSVAEALTNMSLAQITDIADIRCSANWMWAAKLPGEGAAIFDAAKAMRDLMIAVGMAVDGGKDSLSMAAMVRETGQTVKAPGALVISAYAPMIDVTRVLTPDIKRPGRSVLLHVDIARGKRRLGGSALLQCWDQLGDVCPDIDEPELLKAAFNEVQSLIGAGLALAAHDISDGGLIVAALEMAFAGNSGLVLDVKAGEDPIEELFSEEAGLLIECSPEAEAEIMHRMKVAGVPCRRIGKTGTQDDIKVSINGHPTMDEDMKALRALWEETSYKIERLQKDPASADEEWRNIYSRPGPEYVLTFTPEETPSYKTRPRVAILREEGSNSDREMSAAFYAAGFEPWDITMTDLMDGSATLDGMRGAVFVGGFSYADVMDSAKGWAGAIKFNDRIRAEFERFYAKKDTFSLGVCNGCQLMALLGLVPWQGIEDQLQPRFIHNRSGRFESRFSTVTILDSPSIMLEGMEGSMLGVWVAHGEGKVHFPNRAIYDKVIREGLAPVRFTDDIGRITEDYPFNPNGSPLGITALCSPDGRHLALMPHPERTFLKWQWAWLPEQWRGLKVSPWLRMFQNARRWCGEK